MTTLDPACPRKCIDWLWNGECTCAPLDPAYCADGCGRLAETERPTADGRREEVCSEHATLEDR